MANMQPVRPYVPRLDFRNELYIPALQARIAVGTFVMFILPNGNRMKKHIGRLISERKNSKYPFRIQLYQLMNARTLRQLHYVGIDVSIPEVYETDEVKYVNPDTIYDLCFVFPYSQCNENQLNADGIFNVYTIRFRTRNSRFMLIDDTFRSFPCKYDAYSELYNSPCFSLRQWTEINRIKDAMSRILMKTTMAQGLKSRQSIKINISSNLFYYLERVTDHRQLHDNEYNRNKIVHRYTIDNGFDVSKRRCICNQTLLRYETKEHMASLRKYFGNYITYGLRSKKPKVECTKRFTRNMQLNAVHGTDNKEEMFRIHTGNRGIDLIFNHDLEELNIVVRYESYLHTEKVDNVQEEHLRNILQRSHTIDTEDEIDHTSYLVVGALFDDNDDNEFIITEVGEHAIIARKMGTDTLIPFNDIVGVAEACYEKLQ
jgi:hypothetical protein